MIQCDCAARKIVTPDDVGQNHHRMCSWYKTRKYTYLFYCCEGLSAWVPASELIENTIDVADLEEGEERQVIFKRVDLTDEEYAGLKDE